MKVNSKKLSDTRVEITVTLDKTDLSSARKIAIDRLIKEVKLEGFRRGKAPRALAEKALDENRISSETIDHAVRSTVPKAFAQAEKSPLVIPRVTVTKYVPGESAEYTATADILPEIKLGDYKNLNIKRKQTEVKDSDIDEVIENVRKAYAEKKVEKKPAELGDEVIIDFTGTKDGVAFKGGSAKDFPLTLGSHSFIPGFEEGIVGKKSGDRFDLPLTFPKNYPEKSLAGKNTNFSVLVKQVNKFILPDLNEDFAKKCGPFKSIDELRADIKKNLSAQNQAKELEQFKDDLVSKLVEESTVSAPEILIEDQLRLIRSEVERNAASAGLSLEDYLKQDGLDEKTWEEESKKAAEKRVKSSLVLQVLARDEKITVSEDEVIAQLTQLREVYKKSKEALENLKDPKVKIDIQNRMVIEKTLNYLVSVNTKK